MSYSDEMRVDFYKNITDNRVFITNFIRHLGTLLLSGCVNGDAEAWRVYTQKVCMRLSSLKNNEHIHRRVNTSYKKEAGPFSPR